MGLYLFYLTAYIDTGDGTKHMISNKLIKYSLIWASMSKEVVYFDLLCSNMSLVETNITAPMERLFCPSWMCINGDRVETPLSQFR